MSHTVSIEQASHELPGIVRALRPGDEIVITDGKQTVATFTAKTIGGDNPKPIVSKRGAWKGMLEILDDSDDVILEHFKDYLP